MRSKVWNDLAISAAGYLMLFMITSSGNVAEGTIIMFLPLRFSRRIDAELIAVRILTRTWPLSAFCASG